MHIEYIGTRKGVVDRAGKPVSAPVVDVSRKNPHGFVLRPDGQRVRVAGLYRAVRAGIVAFSFKNATFHHDSWTGGYDHYTGVTLVWNG